MLVLRESLDQEEEPESNIFKQSLSVLANGVSVSHLGSAGFNSSKYTDHIIWLYILK